MAFGSNALFTIGYQLFMLKDYPLEKDLLVEDIKNAKKFMEKNNIK